MAKFEIKSIYTFTDELTGEQVTQDSEPTTFKIKLTGDAKTYEKVMSVENEQFFRDWLDNDGADLVGRYQDKIDKLNREIADLVAENENLDAARSKSRSKTVKRDPEQLKAMREWLNANGYKVSDRGRIPADYEAAYNSKTPNTEVKAGADA
ncbi:Lsr2 family DNA-binding protein [Rhodococcus sovatensis]|uniref:Histone-like nucleoid-structuring protein Lsr2 n=1 Tax=Rhodococcus sovatensis TaxID=1805840 RepID=A0ABZ2PNI2_9NOCA